MDPPFRKVHLHPAPPPGGKASGRFDPRKGSERGTEKGSSKRTPGEGVDEGDRLAPIHARSRQGEGSTPPRRRNRRGGTAESRNEDSTEEENRGEGRRPWPTRPCPEDREKTRRGKKEEQEMP
eukprot:scaffold177_cov334-Pavlova_lutheri.AAC.66